MYTYIYIYICIHIYICIQKKSREFLGSPVVKILHFHCRGHQFDPASLTVWTKKKKGRRAECFAHHPIYKD